MAQKQVGRAPSGATDAARLGDLPVAGQCRLTYASATQLLLKPYQGNQLWVNGAFRTIPAAGVTLANTGLAFATLYYVYAFMSGTTLTLEAVTTGHATDATYGHEIKSGDGTRSYIGPIYMDGTSGTGTFADSPAKRYVANWFNRRTASLLGAGTGSISKADQSPAEINPAARVGFVTCGEDGVDLVTLGTAYNNAANSPFFIVTGIDGSASNGVVATGQASVANLPTGLTSDTRAMVSEGFHYATPMGYVAGNTGTFSVQTTGSVRQ